MAARTSRPVVTKFIRKVALRNGEQRFKLRAQDHVRGMESKCQRVTVEEAVDCANQKLGFSR